MEEIRVRPGGPLLTRRQAIAVGAAAVGGLYLEACGGEQPAGGTDRPTGPEFKVGVVLPYSGVYQLTGQSLTRGLDLYFEKAGYRGGDRRIVVAKEDEENSPQTALAKTRKLVEQDGVDMVVGYVATPDLYACIDYLTQNKVPSICANAGGNLASRARRSPFIYRSSFSAWQLTQPLGKYVVENVSKRVVFSVANYGFGNEAAEAFKETFLAGGGQVLREVKTPFPNTSGDFSPFISQILSANAEAVFVFYDGTDAINFHKQAFETGLYSKLKVTAIGVFVERDVVLAVGDSVPNNAITSLHWALTLEHKENKDFVAAYQKKHGEYPAVFAVQGYDTARVIVDALNAVQGKTDNKEQFLKAIGGVKFTSPRGPFRFDPNTYNVVQNIYIRQMFKDSKIGWTNRVITTTNEVADPGK